MSAWWLLVAVQVSAAPPQTTDFGLRTAPGQQVQTGEAKPLRALQRKQLSFDIHSVAALASKWGRVTSTRRSVQRNRAVGGVPNSFHLSGRAIDIARRGGVRHAEIDAAFRRAGYRVIESLDEGDHSHFAFGAASPVVTAARATSTPTVKTPPSAFSWRIVSAPRKGRS